MDIRELGIGQVFDVPLSEISGLGRRPTGERDGIRLTALGDDEFTVLEVTLPSLEGPLRCERFRLQEELGTQREGGSSQWEAADGDASGNVFVLQESPLRVFVLGPHLDRRVCTIDMTLTDSERTELGWETDENARGEGLVLLADSHLLVAKEKDPVVLMEFGPRDHLPGGFGRNRLLDITDRFDVPEDGAEFGLLTSWFMDDESAELIGDVSDIAVGPGADELFLLSDESRCIARIEPALRPESDRLHLSAAWKLPDEIRQPEGLVVLDDRTPVVAIDKEDHEQNLFVLDALPS